MEILIVEDDFISRNLLKKMLAEMGHVAVEAENGIQAWEILKEKPLKIVITDWMMPELDGIQLCRKIRNASFKSYVYIIMLTVRDGKTDLIDVFNAGADDYVPKPFDPEELRARVTTGVRIVHLGERYLETSSQLETKNQKLEKALKRLEETQAQMFQSEKMASIGQLAAGVAHEINNPTGYVSSNLKTLSEYQEDIFELIKKYQDLIAKLESGEDKNPFTESIHLEIEALKRIEKDIDVAFLMDDIKDLIADCREGTERIKKIVIDLKDFAHPGEDKIQSTDINKGLMSTLNVVNNEIKYKATVHNEFGDLPAVQCVPQELNQVFMNILVNAAQAIEEKGDIYITTRAVDQKVVVTISDTGCGIPEEHLTKIFDPFFTTKEVGRGTGLGMNIAYNIVQKHNGTLKVDSEIGKGTTFTLTLPAETSR
ncbi:MAG: response regulator [Desulfobacteraceae bacterium]|jgi:signal transduction histidine kinase